jgi:tRNA A-37 threonylcarbamoyl transferase component Bud32
MPGFEGLLAGRTLCDRYRIEEVIGRGGFAAVYRATDERLGRTVAVKVTTFSATNPETRDEVQKRFRREARAAASLHHPNVVTVYDFGTDPALGLEFFVMELLQGEDLAHRLARPAPLPVRVALRLLRDAAWGVDAGHRAGLVHRDIKPGNIFLARRDRPGRFRVCVLDFGIARPAIADEATQLTRAGGMLLSPAYASPEQLRGELRVSPASDVFSLGVIGYELLTRERPFPGNRLQAPPGEQPAPVPLRERSPEVPPDVAAAIHRALAEDPADRFPTAGAFAEALAAAEPPAEPRDRASGVATPAWTDEPEPPPAEVPPAAAAPPAPSSRELAPEPRPAEVPPPAASPGPPGDTAAADVPTVRYASEVLATTPPAPRPARRRAPRVPRLAAVLLLACVGLALAAWLAIGRAGARPAGSGPVARRESPVQAAREPEPGTPADTAASAAAPTPGAGRESAPPVSGPAPAGQAQEPRTTAPARSAPPAAAPSPGAPRVALRPAPQDGAPRRDVPAPRPASTSAVPVERVPARTAASGGAGTASATRLNREGEALFERNDLARAVERFRLAVRAAPDNAYYRNNLGWALFEMGAVDEAGRELEATLRLDPRREIAYANLGEVRAAQGDTAAAIAAYERFVELNTNPRRERIALGKLRRLRGG